jgi:hypothetical protein
LPGPFGPGRHYTLSLPRGTQAFRIVLYSDPRVLAEGGAATDATFTIPDDIPVGRHTLVVWTLVDGVVQVSGASFDVPSSPTTNLPATGSSTNGSLRVALLLMGLGMPIVALTRRRNRGGES